MAWRLRACTSFVAGFLTLFVLTLTPASRAEAFVYWSDGDKIGRANLDGTGVDRSFIAGVYAPHAVAVDSAHVYWVNSSFPRATIGRANLDGTGVDQNFIGGLLLPGGVAVDAAHVYWGDACEVVVGPDTCSGYGRIGRANLDGTGVDQSFITDAGGARGVAVDAAHVYWVSSGTRFSSDVTIGRANLDGTGVDQSFIAGLDAPTGVAVDAVHVFWADNNQDTIGRANLDGTGIDRRFITRVNVEVVAVDAAHIYWTESFGTIGRANLDGTGVDRRFITRLKDLTGWGLAVDPLRSFSFGKVKKSKRKGTARLTVKVPGPGTLKLTRTESVKGARTFTDVQGKAKLPIKPKREAKLRLKRKGKAKVTAEVTYRPQGGDPTIVGNTLTKGIKLIKR